MNADTVWRLVTCPDCGGEGRFKVDVEVGAMPEGVEAIHRQCSRCHGLRAIPEPLEALENPSDNLGFQMWPWWPRRRREGKRP